MKQQDKKQDIFNSDLESLIISNTNAIRNPGARLQLFIDPNYEEQLKIGYITKIEGLLELLEAQLAELIPWVSKIRGSIGDITEQTFICAGYTLLCVVIESFRSVQILGKTGNYLDIMTINRKIEEAMMQCELFMLDLQEEENRNLENWYSGKIISHSTGRSKLGEVHKDAPIDIEALNNYMYRMSSNISHNGFIGMLEMISPFGQDFDFRGSTRFYRTIGGLEHTIRNLNYFTILLKVVYLYGMKDPISFDAINEILLKYDPDINKTKLSEKVKREFSKN